MDSKNAENELPEMKTTTFRAAETYGDLVLFGIMPFEGGNGKKPDPPGVRGMP